MQSIGRSIVFLVTIYCCLSFGLAEISETRELQAYPGQKLVLDLGCGGSATVEGWNQSRVEVSYTMNERRGVEILMVRTFPISNPVTVPLLARVKDLRLTLLMPAALKQYRL